MGDANVIGAAKASAALVRIRSRAQCSVGILLFAVSGIAWSQMAADPPPPILFKSPLLSQAPQSVPDPIQLAQFIKDKSAALRLGKALFWDMQLGSDGFTACASCHFHAGADNRSKNQIGPGLLGAVKDITFSPQLGSAPNRQLTINDFPFHKLSDPNDRESSVVSDTNDVASSQGVHYGLFYGVSGQPTDNILWALDPEGFNIGPTNVRRVEPRNAPTVINAVFNKVLFWDGRAKDIFNGVNPSGALTTSLYKALNPNQITPVSIQLGRSPLASLSVGPPLSPFEMSAYGRSFREIGSKFLRKKAKKLGALRPLAQQVVHSQDSVLRLDSRYPNPGLGVPTYNALIQSAFKSEWWQANQFIQLDTAGKATVLNGKANPSDPNQYDLREWNFPLFFGLALQEYMATLVSGNTPFDRFQSGDASALTQEQIAGLNLFLNGTTDPNPGAGCNFCHAIPEFTKASVRLVDLGKSGDGFFSIGVRPTAEDPGQAETATGKFKVPSLRNVELTAPYMHNGGMATLEQVVEFYNRGRSDFDKSHGGADPGAVLNLSSVQKANLVAFLKALTDERVRFQKAPFDHPQLFVPNGHPTNQLQVTDDGKGNAKDDVLEIPAVGRDGGPDISRKSFLGIH